VKRNFMVYEIKERLRAQLQLGMRSKERSVVKERYKGVRYMKEGYQLKKG
jgi:hypothetical protein